ncbi:MAG: IS110 family transposase [Proteobacteria bacterium]|nr:IS110 family transposase [Pseudomonadota bacterium]
MVCFAGLDVSLNSTRVCVVDASGSVVKEGQAPSAPAEIAAFLRQGGRRYRHVLLEAGALSRWLYEGLVKAGFPAVMVETRHASAVLKGGRFKTDRTDARGLADMARAGLFKPVTVKSAETQRMRGLMSARSLLVAKAVDLEVAIRGLMRGFGVKLGVVSERQFHTKVVALTQNNPPIAGIVRPLLRARSILREQATVLEQDFTDRAHADPVCRRLMTAPGVGPLVALTYKLAVEDPARFKRSRSVAAHLGLTQRLSQSGELARRGRISCWGDADARRALFLAGRSVLNPRTGTSNLKAWGLQVAVRRGKLRAYIAVARRLAVILHRMWVDETDFRSAAAA